MSLGLNEPNILEAKNSTVLNEVSHLDTVIHKLTSHSNNSGKMGMGGNRKWQPEPSMKMPDEG